MDFSLPKEYELFRRMVRDFVENEVRPLARKIDREHRVPFETIQKAAKLGLMGVPFPQKYGGVGAGETSYCILMEEVNKACGSTAAVIGAHTGIGAMAIYLDGRMHGWNLFNFTHKLVKYFIELGCVDIRYRHGFNHLALCITSRGFNTQFACPIIHLV